jgi:hypothetical protein
MRPAFVVRGSRPALREGPKVCRLLAGGMWIRTSSTRAPVNRVIPLLCCPIAWDELARARVLLGSYDLTREEIWVNIVLVFEAILKCVSARGGLARPSSVVP